MSDRLTKFVIAITLVAFLSPAQGGLISTGEALDLRAGSSLEQVERYLLRDEVAAELATLGVTPEQALARAAALSDAELEALAGRIAEQPAGAGALEVLGIVFLVLIVLELVGVTNIFRR